MTTNSSSGVYIIDDLLDEIDVLNLLAAVSDEKENFVPTGTVTNAVDYRRSTMMTVTPAFIRQLFHHKVISLLPQVCRHLWHPDFILDDAAFECQVTRSGHGDFYLEHIDNCPPCELRELTYVYYFHTNQFTGGELVFIDDGTIVKPLRNRFIVFDSSRMHQVLPVTVTGANTFENGRFTVNGWLRRRADP
jgi:Rps23 Pro-64 3,4-dihydroxylase Tpa1-like proline 4-hydroxylase